MPSPTNQLWHLYRKGNIIAFEQIYYQHVNILYDYGLRMTQDTALVEDCIQDLFSNLWEKRTQMKEVYTVKSYLIVSLKRALVKKLVGKQKEPFLRTLEISIHPHSFDLTFCERSTAEKFAYLAHAFTKLSDKQKEVIYLRFYNQLSYQEIADIMSVQVKAVYELMGRAIQMLRTDTNLAVLNLFLSTILTNN
uniref:Sigma-70 family RNA polymerase sigma factor n=1 Tax=Roseihalotalea indica TaxID=2867963 RepID=A0AA49JEP8_9BACT|nr:sigma-70 family RNA polymerase sigma factor [Tunicatimonas sp. TK19036]